ncbi:MAG: hypothetical protein RJA63_3286 [Pseudomonadota bacterium]|jgi:hypothetical protein
MSRLVCQFSCGAASAVATKLMLAEAPERVAIVNAFISEEHPDNRRFLADCERWFGRAVTVLRDEKYGASTLEVFRRERYLNGRAGAPCTRALKRKLLDKFRQPGDVMVLGFDADEADRLDDFRERFPDVPVRAPLIERSLGKADCLGLLERAGIELPAMYRLGFNNANCIGCVKGGMGYWNHVRKTFHERFAQVAAVEREIGPSAYLFRDRATGVRFGLDALPPDAGRHDEILPDCGLFCEAALHEVAA